MDADFLFSLLGNPYFWSCNVLVLILLPSVAGMLFAKGARHSAEKTWAYRETGVEIASVLLPFALYAVAHLLNGSFLKFLTTPELSMAALLMFGITIVSLLKAAFASKGEIPLPALLVLLLCAMLLFLLCTGLVFWLTLAAEVSAWFSVLNSIVVVSAVWFSFGVSAAMNYISKHPTQAFQGLNQSANSRHG